METINVTPVQYRLDTERIKQLIGWNGSERVLEARARNSRFGLAEEVDKEEELNFSFSLYHMTIGQHKATKYRVFTRLVKHKQIYCQSVGWSVGRSEKMNLDWDHWMVSWSDGNLKGETRLLDHRAIRLLVSRAVRLSVGRDISQSGCRLVGRSVRS